MMIFAVMMSMLLVPAQIMAKNNNRDFAKPRVENRMNNKRDFKVAKKNKRNDKFAKANDRKFKNKKMAKRPMAMAKRPAPRPKPMPRPLPRPIPRPRPVPRPVYYHNHCCTNDVVETAATIVGIAALAALIAD